MNNKGPVLISYLSQIILIIVLLQVSNSLKWFTIIVTLITEALIAIALIKEKRWNFQAWYAFFIFAIILIFILTQMMEGLSKVTAPLSVELIVALIIGFFITVFSRQPEDEVPKVNVVDLEPKIERIVVEKTKKTIKKKKTTNKKTTKKKIPKKTKKKTAKKTSAKKTTKKKTPKKKSTKKKTVKK